MGKLRVIDRDGIEHELEARTGRKLMETLREYEFGVAAICGGMCSCGTCHVYVDPEWAPRLPPGDENERSLLNELDSVRPTSRLSCQIEVTEELSGLRVTVAPDQ